MPSAVVIEGARGRWDGWLLSGAALLAYVLLGQVTWFGDGPALLLGSGAAATNHMAFMPLLNAVAGALEGLGVSVYRAALLIGASGSAFAVLCAHVGVGLMGGERRERILVALLVASAPPILFFATVVELHGLFAGFLGLVALVAAWYRAAPGVLRAHLLGAASGLSYLAHSTGALLPMLLLPLCLLAATRRERILHAALLCVGHVSVIVILNVLVRAEAGQGAEIAGWEFFRRCVELALDRPEGIPRVLWNEWLFALLPLSGLLHLCLLRSRARRAALWLHLSLLGYLAFVFLILSSFWPSERGAYLLPFVFPAAWLTVRAFGTRVAVLALLVSMALGLGGIVTHDRSAELRELASALRTELGTQENEAFFLMVTHDDVGARYALAPEVPAAYFFPFLDFDDEAMLPAVRQQLAGHLDGLLGRGTRLYLSRDGLQYMRADATEAAIRGPGWIVSFLDERFAWRPVEGGPLVELRAR